MHLLGVAANQKGFKVYDIQTKVLFTSRDVHCYEDMFPYSHSQTNPPILPTTACDISNTNPDTPSNSPTASPSPTTSRPRRHTHEPTWLQDYVHNSHCQPMNSNEHCSLNVSTVEPSSYQQACKSNA